VDVIVNPSKQVVDYIPNPPSYLSGVGLNPWVTSLTPPHPPTLQTEWYKQNFFVQPTGLDGSRNYTTKCEMTKYRRVS
jgi:hypothetical protein